MKNKKGYNAYTKKQYYIVKQNNKQYFKIDNLLLEICPNKYIPKSGLLYDILLNKDICFNKKILDLGCGYLGIISIISKLNGAKTIDAVDYDVGCIQWFTKIINNNNLNNINCFKSNWFSNIINKDYDIIISNPPQMPMCENALHDSGGIDGRKAIIEILENSINYLAPKGTLYILLFDFLGVSERTNDELSIFEIANKIGYKDIKIVLEETKRIIKNSVTYKNLDYIKLKYPLYQFEKNDETTCKIQILSMKK